MQEDPILREEKIQNTKQKRLMIAELLNKDTEKGNTSSLTAVELKINFFFLD